LTPKGKRSDRRSYVIPRRAIHKDRRTRTVASEDRMSRRRVSRRTITVVVVGALLGVAGDAAAQGIAKGSRTTRPVPVPVSSAAGRAVNAALRSALTNDGVRNAVRVELLRQLRARRPLALVGGHWVSVVDLAPAYQAAAVRPALLAALGTNAPRLLNEASVSADRLTLVFVPAAAGQIAMPDFARDVTAVLGVDALKHHMTDVGPYVVIAVLAASGLGLTIMFTEMAAMWWEWLSMKYNDYTQATGPNADYDGDGISNKDDKDDDNAGVDDEKDNYPHDPTRQICACDLAAISLAGTAGTGDVLKAYGAALRSAQTRSARGASLGPIQLWQGATATLVF
jgi:hypothetical protein